jgi:hypothetical protein
MNGGRAMRHSVAAQDFGRAFLKTVEQTSGGAWVRSADVFEQAIRENPDNEYVKYLSGNMARRIKVTYIVEERREKEFPHVKRRKDGKHQAAPVYFRAPAL